MRYPRAMDEDMKHTHRMAQSFERNLRERASDAVQPVSHWLLFLANVAGVVAEVLEDTDDEPQR